MIDFAQLETGAVQIGCTAVNSRRRLQRLKEDYGPVREVTWLEGDFTAAGACHQR